MSSDEDVSDTSPAKAAESKRPRSLSSCLPRPSVIRRRQLGKRHVSDECYVEDVSLELFYKPHSIVALVTVLSILVLNAFSFHIEDTTRARTLRGLAGAAFAFLLFGMLSLPSGPFIRPHPFIWRLVLACSVLYWLVLVGIIFQDYSDLRIFIGIAFPELQPDRTSGPLPWTEVDFLDADTYAQDCSVTYDNVMLRFDIFIVAHLLGCLVKAMMLRSYAICMIGSIWWEITEMFFAHILPNFVECWWDQFLLDVCIFNMLGIVCGIQVCRYLEVREYHWRSFRELPTTGMKIKRVMQQFTPQTWTIVRWTPLISWKRYTQVVILVMLLTIVELNAFFLKSTFEIKTSHPINVGRCVLWGIIGLPALRQTYVFMSDPSCIRLGTQAWVAFAIIVTECLLWLKFGCLRQDAPWDVLEILRILSMWVPCLFLFTFACLYLANRLENLQFFKNIWATKFD